MLQSEALDNPNSRISILHSPEQAEQHTSKLNEPSRERHHDGESQGTPENLKAKFWLQAAAVGIMAGGVCAQMAFQSRKEKNDARPE